MALLKKYEITRTVTETFFVYATSKEKALSQVGSNVASVKTEIKIVKP